MRILGIETSCDETAVAIVSDGVTVLSNVIASSKSSFTALAGVIPEEAARKQVECMIPVLKKTLADAGTSMEDIDTIAVTRGPGLLGSLLVGTSTARILGAIWRKPVIGVHHTLGHLSSVWLSMDDTIVFPVLTLSASGGHTDLWYRESHTRGRLLGKTRDDAAGEAFDKGASMLGLPYPGGPSVAKAALSGDLSAHRFPDPLSQEDTMDFSFSGLKTALKYTLRDAGFPFDGKTVPSLPERLRNDLAASYEHALCRHLLNRISYTLSSYPECRELHLVGGVSANLHLRSLAQALCDQAGIRLRYPKALEYCTDNAAMIASAGFFLFEEQGERAFEPFLTQASLPLLATIS